jgi:membrane-bound lytic murein transglycosylase
VNSPCTQKFLINLIISTACSFTGTYVSQFKLGCHKSITNPTNCPVDLNNNNVQISIDSNSENFCVVANVEINLEGSLFSYSDLNFQTLKNLYFSTETSYFKAMVSSSKAQISSSKLLRAQWTVNDNTVVLYDNFQNTATGTQQEFKLISNGINFSTFSFVFKNSVKIDGNATFLVSATIQVSYLAIDGQTTNQIVESTLFDIKQSQSTQSQKFLKTIVVSYSHKIISNYFLIILIIGFFSL